MVSDIGAAAGAETVALIAACKGEALFQAANVAEEASVAGMVAATVAAFGRLDCAVNAAGIDPKSNRNRDGTWPRWTASCRSTCAA